MQQVDFNALTQRALKNIRALTRGNGAEESAVQISKSDTDHIHCDAITHIELHYDLEEEKKAGQVQKGQVLSSPEELSKMIDDTLAQTIKNTDARKFMANQLLSRGDKGFAVHGEYFDLPNLNRDYSVHEACGGCGGQGQTGCDNCHGTREEVCHVCLGKGMAPCQHCYGTGMIDDGKGGKKPCHHCGGTRHVTCVLCQRRGRVVCRKCKGAGSIKCNQCKGLGVFTRITHLLVKMKTLFEIDRAVLPHPAVKAIERQGTRMVERGHIELSAEQVKREDGGLAIQYHCNFPYIISLFAINGKPIKIEQFGFKGKIMKAPAFIETLTGTQIALLEQAARGDGAVQSKIIKASKTRLIAESLGLVLRMRRKRAMIALKKKYPIGISNEGLKNLVNTSKKALDQLTKKARYSAYAIAGLSNLTLFALYFMGGVRDMITPLIQGNLIAIIDLALIPLGGFIGALVTRQIIKRPLQKALGTIPKNMKGNQTGVITNYILSAGLFIVMLIVLFFLGQDFPSWIPL